MKTFISPSTPFIPRTASGFRLSSRLENLRGFLTRNIPDLRLIRISILAFLLCLATGCGPAGGPFVVNNSGDMGDIRPGDGFCLAISSPATCTLRAAVEESNALAGRQTINFNLPAGDETIYARSRLPYLTDDITIDGTTQPGFDGVSPAVLLDGSGIVFHGEPTDSGFFIDRRKSVTLKGIRIQYFPRSGIDNVGMLTLDHMEMVANGAFGIDSNILYEEITVTIVDTTISENGATGIYGDNTHLFLTRVTITKNKGGLNVDAGSLHLTQCVIADNTNTTGPGGIFFAMGSDLTIADSLIQRNTNTSAGPFAGGMVIWDATANISHTTISENTGRTSGGIYIGSGTVHLIGSTLTKNRGDDAGAVYVAAGGEPPALYAESGTWIGKSGEGNIANSVGEGTKFGGGIYSQSDVHIYDSFVEGNLGAGIQMDPAGEASLHILRSHIRNNSRAGLYALNTNLTFTDGTVRGNGGGGIRVNGGALTLTRGTVADNYYAGMGGGIYGENLTTIGIRESTISGNVSDSIGGGAYFAPDSGTVDLSNVTLSGNRAGRSGGGLTSSSGLMHLANVTVARNTAPQWAGLNSEGSTTIANSLFAENSNGNCGGPGIITSTGHNLDDGNSCPLTGPGDLTGYPALLGPLQDNGGPTFTHALLPGSPATDAGDDAACPTLDQRGIARPQGLHCDMGAFEAESPATATPPAVTNTLTPTLIPSKTPTSTPAPIIFDPVNFSTEVIYSRYGRSCTPKEVTIQVKVSPPELVYSLGLFYRLVEKEGTNVTPWSAGFSMIPQGGGWFTLTVYSEDFPDTSKWGHDAWLEIQLVANGKDGQPVARSEVYRKVTLGRCMQ